MVTWIKHTWKAGVEDWRDDRLSTESMALLAAGLFVLAALAWIAE